MWWLDENLVDFVDRKDAGRVRLGRRWTWNDASACVYVCVYVYECVYVINGCENCVAVLRVDIFWLDVRIISFD